MTKRLRRWAALCGVLVLTAAGCGGDDDGEDVVTIFGAFVDEEAEAFEEALATFEEDSGIDVRYEGTGDFNDLIRIRAEADDLADIVIFPNPGLMTEFANDDHIVELTGEALTSFNENYTEDWQSFASVGDSPYGIFIKAAPKSLVWYPQPEFSDAGYEVPETWQQLLDLSEQIEQDGNTPWCIGIEDGESTGWVGTDWMEDIVLRMHGGDVYDQWVNHQIAFDDPRIVASAQMMTDIWRNPEFVRGGPQAILSTSFGDAPDPMFEDEPGCFLHRQASFITTFFPDAVQDSLSGDEPRAGVFALPPINGDAAPAVGGGDLAGMTSARAQVVETMAFLGTTEFAAGWAPVGGYISPHREFDVSLYPSEIERQIGQLVADAPVFRFDASDLMPSEVGAGTFWEAIVDMTEGTAPATALAAVEASWPSDT